MRKRGLIMTLGLETWLTAAGEQCSKEVFRGCNASEEFTLDLVEVESIPDVT